MKKDKNDSFNPDDLPQNGVFKKKEIDQYKQPPAHGKPIENTGNTEETFETGKDADKTSKEEGLNEANSAATNGAFEGFESRRKVD